MVRLAHTRLRVGLGRFGRFAAGPVANRLSVTSFAVRTVGCWLWTAAMSPSSSCWLHPFRAAHDPLGAGRLDHRNALQSIAPTRISPSAGAIRSCARPA
jgi:hypothetical protein